MSLFALSHGLFWEGDIVSLSSSLYIEDTCLVDSSNGARHLLIGNSYDALCHLEEPISATSWVSTLYKLNLSSERISEIIIFLNSIGALIIKRSFVSGIRSESMRIQFRLRGLKLETMSRRRSVSILGISNSIVNAMVTVVFLVLITSIFEYGAGFSSVIYLASNIIFVICLWLSVLMHEYVHVLFAINNKLQPVVLQKGLRVGILHPRLSSFKELASAVGGPLAGFLTSILFALLIFTIFEQIVPVLLALLVALFHLLSWLPGYGDGKAIIKQIRSHYATTS